MKKSHLIIERSEACLNRSFNEFPLFSINCSTTNARCSSDQAMAYTKNRMFAAMQGHIGSYRDSYFYKPCTDY